jgi:hypothetical protein
MNRDKDRNKDRDTTGTGTLTRTGTWMGTIMETLFGTVTEETTTANEATFSAGFEDIESTKRLFPFHIVYKSNIQNYRH